MWLMTVTTNLKEIHVFQYHSLQFVCEEAKRALARGHLSVIISRVEKES